LYKLQILRYLKVLLIVFRLQVASSLQRFSLKFLLSL